MAHRVSADRAAIQNEMVPFLLLEIVKLLKKKDGVPELLELLDDLNITNEMIKEHLPTLSLD